MNVIELKHIYQRGSGRFDKNTIIKNDIKKLYALPDSLEDLTLWNIIVVIAALVIGITLLSAPIVGGEDGLKLHSCGICGAIIFFAVSSYMLRKAISGKWLLRVTLALGGIYGLVYIAAVNNFPEFIRSIKGESFIGIWLVYSLIIYIFVLIIQLNGCHHIANKSLIRLQKLPYSDEELMFISRYSRFRVTGYYLIKAKGDGIIAFVSTEAEPDVIQVRLNDRISDKAIEDYCSENPEVKNIIELLKSRRELGTEGLTIRDVVIKTRAELSFKGESIRALMQELGKAERFNNILKYIGIGLAYYLGITKLIMGLINDKPVENLGYLGFFLSLILLAAFLYLSNAIVEYTYEEDVFKKLLSHNEYLHDDFEKELQFILAAEGAVTPKRYEDILRCYASSKEMLSKTKNAIREESRYVRQLAEAILAEEKRSDEISAVVDAAGKSYQEQVDRNKRNMGTYYGCSSCGGGCGGGGCGGCGD